MRKNDRIYRERREKPIIERPQIQELLEEERLTKDLLTKDLLTKDLLTKDLLTKDLLTKDLYVEPKSFSPFDPAERKVAEIREDRVRESHDDHRQDEIDGRQEDAVTVDGTPPKRGPLYDWKKLDEIAGLIAPLGFTHPDPRTRLHQYAKHFGTKHDSEGWPTLERHIDGESERTQAIGTWLAKKIADGVTAQYEPSLESDEARDLGIQRWSCSSKKCMVLTKALLMRGRYRHEALEFELKSLNPGESLPVVRRFKRRAAVLELEKLEMERVSEMKPEHVNIVYFSSYIPRRNGSFSLQIVLSGEKPQTFAKDVVDDVFSNRGEGPEHDALRSLLMSLADKPILVWRSQLFLGRTAAEEMKGSSLGFGYGLRSLGVLHVRKQLEMMIGVPVFTAADPLLADKNMGRLPSVALVSVLNTSTLPGGIGKLPGSGSLNLVDPGDGIPGTIVVVIAHKGDGLRKFLLELLDKGLLAGKVLWLLSCAESNGSDAIWHSQLLHHELGPAMIFAYPETLLRSRAQKLVPVIVHHKQSGVMERIWDVTNWADSISILHLFALGSGQLSVFLAEDDDEVTHV